jgi:hypothetical protein
VGLLLLSIIYHPRWEQVEQCPGRQHTCSVDIPIQKQVLVTVVVLLFWLPVWSALQRPLSTVLDFVLCALQQGCIVETTRACTRGPELINTDNMHAATVTTQAAHATLCATSAAVLPPEHVRQSRDRGTD